MTVDIDLPDTSSGSIVPGGPSVVADQWDHNTGVVKLVLDVLHVFAVWEDDPGAGLGLGVLVFDLNKYDWAAVGDLVLGEESSDFCHVVVGGRQVVGGVSPQLSLNALKPSGKAPTRGLCIHVGTRSGDDVQASSLGSLQERLDDERTLSVEVASFALESPPVQVDGDGVETQGLDLGHDVGPEGRHRQSEGVKLSRVDQLALAVDKQGVVVKGDDILKQVSVGGLEELLGSSKQGVAGLDRQSDDAEDVGEPHCDGEKQLSTALTSQVLSALSESVDEQPGRRRGYIFQGSPPRGDGQGTGRAVSRMRLPVFLIIAIRFVGPSSHVVAPRRAHSCLPLSMVAPKGNRGLG